LKDGEKKMHASKLMLEVEKSGLRSDMPDFRTGDSVRVHAKISEGEKSRIQIVEGVVLKRSGKGSTKTFTLRKVSDGIGVEIVYPVCSPAVTKVEITSPGAVRRARIYYVRKLTGKAASIKKKKEVVVPTTKSATA
jgi:large subunit ribosomal protein L19